jgi:threonine/homoserine/homoserine lactone efflux protein
MWENARHRCEFSDRFSSMILDPQLYALFFTAALLLTLAPGPDTLFVLGSSLGNGARGGLLASAGILSGLLVHICFAVVGVSAVIAASPLAFDILRWAGAAYLLWIGVQLLIKAWHNDSQQTDVAASPTSSRVFWQGAATNILNPKVAVFYIAFLPQFVAPELGHPAVQLLLLGLTHWAMGIVYLGAVALAGGSAANILRRSSRARRVLDGVSGLIFVGLALRLAFIERRG